MGCRNDPGDPRRCERCGAFLWVAEEGLFCGDCGTVMPCTMRVVPLPHGPMGRRNAGGAIAHRIDAARAPSSRASATDDAP